MAVPFNDLARSVARDRAALNAAMGEVLDSGWFVLGPRVLEVERAIAQLVGVPHAVGVASGTDALELAIRASMPEGRSVVVTAANAGGYTAVAARRAGFDVRWAEIDEHTLCLDPAALPAVLGPDVGVVVATHLYGRMAETEPLADLAHAAGAALIEDCAQAIGARRDGRMAGSIGDAAAFSFYPTKNLGALGDGGMVVTDSDELAERLRTLRQYGWGDKYDAVLPGGANSRLDELQAAVLLARLGRLEDDNARRRAIVRAYRDAASALSPDVLRIPPADGEDHVAHLAVALSGDRHRVLAHFDALGIGTAVHYPVADYDQPALASDRSELPITTRAVAQVVSLPCFPEMTDSEIAEVTTAIAALG